MDALSLDEDLTLEESPWRGRIITAGVLLLIAAAVAVGLYFFYFRSTSTTSTRATEDIPVKRGTINQTLIISGTADADLNSNLIFQSAGKVAQINVKVGDAVKQGQVLAALESDDLTNNVQTARANLTTAGLKLQDLLDGATAADIAAADQAVASAQTAVIQAQNAQRDLLDGPKAADLAAAQQAVQAAQTQLVTATSNRDTLRNTPNPADLAAAQAAVTAAQSGLTAAQNSAASSQNTVTTASASLQAAEAGYCAADATPAFCTLPATPISGADATIMNAALAGTHATLASAVIAANSTYLNALNAAASAQAAVSSAQDALSSAQKRLAQVQAGPTSDDLAAAAAVVASAQAALDAANAKLADLQSGATAMQRSNAQAAVDSAVATLAAAQAKRDQIVSGPTANQVAQAREAIRTAQLAVDAANIRLRDTQIIAPFDGVVGAVNAKVGEFASQASTAPPIVLLTPDRLVLKMDVGETDYANVKLGQAGGVLFDSIPGKIYPFVISEIGLSPSVTQGVTTYQVQASLIVPAGAPRPAPGMNARGQIITDSRPNILVVPPRAVHRSGSNQVVDVRRNGAVLEQVITTGVSDNDNVEVLSGLTDGDVVVAPALGSASAGPTAKAQPTLPGGVK
ncbi:MAG TPA: biotin/lipoyl-binding protein [Dehalococcoidia bacterium]|nr:biotin/lipoyl-binding protein [Dehalococcoidia bacterium]